MDSRNFDTIMSTHEEHVAQEGHYVRAFARALSDDGNNCLVVAVEQ